MQCHVIKLSFTLVKVPIGHTQPLDLHDNKGDSMPCAHNHRVLRDHGRAIEAMRRRQRLQLPPASVLRARLLQCQPSGAGNLLKARALYRLACSVAWSLQYHANRCRWHLPCCREAALTRL